MKTSTKEIDLSTSDEGDWVRLEYEGFKPQTVHKSLFPQLVSDMERRGGRDLTFSRVRSYEYNIPSNVTNWPKRMFSVDSLKITVSVNDFGSMLERVMELPFRFFTNGTPYRKLHSHSSCLVLTPDQQTAIVCAMEIDRYAADFEAWEHVRR